jgi:hypothetical protein
MAEPRPRSPEPAGTFYMLKKEISPKDLKPSEKPAFNATIAKYNNTVGSEFKVIPGPAGPEHDAFKFVYAENYKNGKAAMIPKRLLDSHFVKEKGHTTEERGTALGKRKKRNRTMRKKHRRSRKHGRKSRKHHRRRH